MSKQLAKDVMFGDKWFTLIIFGIISMFIVSDILVYIYTGTFPFIGTIIASILSGIVCEVLYVAYKDKRF